PPITVPAWSSMLSSRDPGELGIYGFRDRSGHGYGESAFASSYSVRLPRLWEMLPPGARSILIGVPQTYPPPAVDGWVVSCLLTPSAAKVTTHPPELRRELDEMCGGYTFDVEDFRSSDRSELLERIYAKTRQDFAVARHLATTRPWNLLAMVVMGTDRIQHAFWPRQDDDAAPGWSVLLEYYRALDAEIGALQQCLAPDAVMLVVSDHGAKRMEGGIFLNQWLIDNGYLRLLEEPVQPTPLRPAMVDWAHTTAWADGGYCGRIYLNVSGREPAGTVAAADVEALCDELARGIAGIAGPQSDALGSVVHRPRDLYAAVEGVAPELFVYLGNLGWRALGSVGAGSWYADGNDTGPDGANHDHDGILILADPQQSYGGVALDGLQLMDVAPTVLSFFLSPCEYPAALRGKNVRPDLI
ncbi:MAG TPA: alkaline phosphatase family protein, partial [Terriglobales bacterium]|nr:alkaline phosphatase family protein [Terriglobales bacterium]